MGDSKKIGLLVGREWSFPPAFLEEVNRRNGGVVAAAEPASGFASGADLHESARTKRRAAVFSMVGSDYQTVQRLVGAIALPGLQENAFSNSGLSETGPFTRHCAVECSLFSACVRAASGR